MTTAIAPAAAMPPALADGPPVEPPLDHVRYGQTLDAVEAGLDRVHQALHRSRRASAAGRTRHLAELHTQLRALGQLLNDAQGGWPPPPPPDEAA
ncbi:hypothetical protein GCM10022255_085950 [Dactylosporangium darangshiense]|uniref:Uncharacterized protein n=1 Tax=Dactylosporangium darangshiense TaxID=579108 RepID=A0ABP8DMM4_9ACTN